MVVLEIALFPLNTVLFPGMPITLHIFEDRYKQMIQQCIDRDEPFGVVLIKEGQEAMGPLAVPHDIGCTAQITHVEKLAQGRMNIIAIGGERFRVHSLDSDSQPYLIGQVELAPVRNDSPQQLAEETARLRVWVKRYIETLQQAGQTAVNLARMPDDPLLFACLAVTLLQIPAWQKQALLAIEQAVQFAAELCKVYRREVSLLDVLLENPGKNKGADNPLLN